MKKTLQTRALHATLLFIGAHAACGQVYQHYKGNYYVKVGVVRRESDLEMLVLYRGLANEAMTMGDVWSRPVREFYSEVENADGQMVPRFRAVSQAELETVSF